MGNWDDGDDNLIDRETRKHILNLRKQIDDDERQLFIESQTNPDIGLSHEQSTYYWSLSVRQYLRGIKRLWGDDISQVKNADNYWARYQRNGQEGLGTMQLIPPDKDGYQFSLVAVDKDSADIKRALHLPPEAELPEPATKTFAGLADVLYTPQFEHTWSVTVDPRNRKTITLQNARPVPKPILEETVEAADEFLQQSGLGFEITPTEIEVHEDEPI
jgi:hypothetical protein